MQGGSYANALQAMAIQGQREVVELLLEDLYGRLEELPVDQDDLYRKALNQMNPFYKR